MNLPAEEMAVFLVSSILLLAYLWVRFYRASFKALRFSLSGAHRAAYVIVPFLCLALISTIVWKWSSPDVRRDPAWMMFYTVGGAIWLEAGLFLLSLLGVGARDDVVERQNPAAAWVVYGAMLGTALCYAGSTMGAGPGLEVDLFCVLLSSGFLFGFWLVCERLFRLSDRISIDRDESAGIRAGGWMASLGLIFGTAVTGNWVSMEGTLHDFVRHGWVAILFLVGATAVESAFKALPARGNAHRATSMVVGLAYFLAAILWIAYLARPGVHSWR